MKPFPRLVTLTVALAGLAACSSPQGRIKDESEESLVGARSAGAATYNDLIRQTTDKLLEEHRIRSASEARKLIAFVGVENKSAEELGANREAIYETIDTVIVNSRVYVPVSKRVVDVAMRETGMRSDQLLLAEPRQKFMTVLGREGQTPDYLLWGKLTTLSTLGENVKEREYLLTMEMVDANTGLVDAKQTAKVRKEYLR